MIMLGGLTDMKLQSGRFGFLRDDREIARRPERRLSAVRLQSPNGWNFRRSAALLSPGNPFLRRRITASTALPRLPRRHAGAEKPA